MRFSSVFQLPAVPQQPAAPAREAAPQAQADEQAPLSAAPAEEPADDLDERVRRIGEWQLGEGY